MNLIKKFSIGMLMLGTVLVTTSCEDELIDLNVNPNAIENVDYGIQFTKVQLYTTGTRYEIRRASLGYAYSSIQQFADLASTNLPGDKYTQDPGGYAASLFDRAYTNEYKDLTDIIERASQDEAAGTVLAQANIWKVVSFHRLTDMYGDVPYHDAGRGYLDNNFYPVYDSQESIYNDMLQTLESSVNQLNASSKTMGDQDIVFQSDISKWKKMAYSYMLRLGMRLSKVDPAAAQSWVSKAIAGGVMNSLDDSVVINHQTNGGWNNTNPFGEAFEQEKLFRLSETLVNWLINNNDPRLDVVGWVETGGAHKGMPNGKDATTIQSDPSWTELLDYTQVNQDLVQRDSPSVLMTYAEVELLLAEAAERGWYNGNAETHYNNGVRAAMEQYGIYGVSTPTNAEVDAYLAANPYNDANGLEMIGEQYWMATFLNCWEGYSNYRRTGFPVLQEINYPGNITGGKIPRRLTYPDSEYTSNPDNVANAVSRQGADAITTRVWWDQ